MSLLQAEEEREQTSLPGYFLLLLFSRSMRGLLQFRLPFSHLPPAACKKFVLLCRQGQAVSAVV
jgi:hypothetical protein